MNDPRVEEALRQVNEPEPERWRPNPGDTIAGVMVEYRKRHFRAVDDDGVRRNKTVIVYYLDVGEKIVAVDAGHQVLKQELRHAHIGDAVAVKFHGMQGTSDGERGYAFYSVAIKKAEPS